MSLTAALLIKDQMRFLTFDTNAIATPKNNNRVPAGFIGLMFPQIGPGHDARLVLFNEQHVLFITPTELLPVAIIQGELCKPALTPNTGQMTSPE